MNINFTPAIRKTVLGGMAALAVAGGAMVSCQNNTKNTEADNAKLEQTMEALSNMNKISAENTEILDSILSKCNSDSTLNKVSDVAEQGISIVDSTSKLYTKIYNNIKED